MEHWSLPLSARCYKTMLFLLPLEFRLRFRDEMTQVFSDSCRDEVENGRSAALPRFWLRALVDLLVSVLRERGRALDLKRLPTYAGGAVDSVVILAIIVFHLLAAGTGLAWYMPRSYETAWGFFVVSAGLGAALGGVGVVCSLVLARFRRIHYRVIAL